MKHEQPIHHGQRLAQLLKDNNVTASECARRLACTRQAVSKMMRCDELRVGRLRTLTRIFKVPMEYFVGL